MQSEDGGDNIIQFPEGGKEGMEKAAVEEKKSQIAKLKEQLQEVTRQRAEANVAGDNPDLMHELEEKQINMELKIKDLILDISGALPVPNQTDFINPDDR